MVQQDKGLSWLVSLNMKCWKETECPNLMPNDRDVESRLTRISATPTQTTRA